MKLKFILILSCLLVPLTADAAQLTVDWSSGQGAALLSGMVTDGENVFCADSNGVLSSLRVKDGVKQWSTQLPSWVEGQILVTDRDRKSVV